MRYTAFGRAEESLSSGREGFTAAPEIRVRVCIGPAERLTAAECKTGLWAVSAAPHRFDRGNVDLLHAHHRIERALCFIAAGGERLGQHARRDLPGDAPFDFAPAARALLAAIAVDGVPIAVGLLLIVGGNEKASLCLNAAPPLRPRQGMPATVNSTVSTSPALPEG
jgi:hypothetical protein